MHTVCVMSDSENELPTKRFVKMVPLRVLRGGGEGGLRGGGGLICKMLKLQFAINKASIIRVHILI